MDAKDQGTVLLEKLRAMNQATNPGDTLKKVDNAGNGVEGAESMPAHYFTPDATDDLVVLRNKMATAARPSPLSDAEIGSYLRKAAAVETAKFDQWFANTWKLDSANPTLQKWGQEVNPEYFARREQVIDEQTRIQNMLAKIKLRGVHTREETELLYAIAMGHVTIPKKPIFEHEGTTANSTNIKRGLFNPFRVAQTTKQAGYLGALPLGGFPRPGTKEGIGFNFPLLEDYAGAYNA